jgi:hypothetical protein
MSRNALGWNASKDDDWRKFLVPEKDNLTLPRRGRGLATYGPDELRIREDIVYEGGPVAFVRNNPQLFATSSTSAHEGFFYWGLVKKIGKEDAYGTNGLIWQYQVKMRGAAGGPGGAIVDFVISNTIHGLDLGVRIVTPYYHSGAGPLKRGEDFEQQYTMMDSGVFPVDVYSVNYISDPTGRAVLNAVDKAIAAQPDYSPLYRTGNY